MTSSITFPPTISINQTANVSLGNSTDALVYKVPFNQSDVIIFGVSIFVFVVFGLLANILLIIVIATSNRLRSIFYYLITSLCVSDSISALISWVNWYRRTLGYDHYLLPDFTCFIYWGADIMTSYVTALHILSFAILRFIGLKFPLIMSKISSGNPHGLILIGTIWVIGFFSGGIPMGLFSGARPRDRSANTPDSKWPSCTQLPEWMKTYSIYTKVAYPIFFYTPIITTFFISLGIVIMMIKKHKKVSNHLSNKASVKRYKKQKQTILQLLLIVLSFFIGYIPFTVFEFHTLYTKNDTYETRWIDWHFGTAQYMCLRVSECLNPVLYILGSEKMFKETKRFVLQRICCYCISKERKRRSSSVVSVTSGISSTFYAVTETNVKTVQSPHGSAKVKNVAT